MLINFSVENFRSIGSEQTLNLVASKGQKGHEDYRVLIAGTDELGLRTSVIYGANAAGKSNLFRTMEFAQDLIVDGPAPRQQIALSQFRFTDESGRPSSFEFRFVADEQIFVYGFDVTPDEVIEEWLSATNQRGRAADVFHRKGKDIKFGNLKECGEEGTTSAEALKALELLATRPNQLLLNKIVDRDDERRGTLLDKVFQWFTVRLTIIGTSSGFAPLLEHLSEDSDFKRFTSEFPANVGTGIGDIEVEQTQIEADKLPKELAERLQSLQGEGSLPLSIRGDGMSLSLDPDDSSKVIRRNLSATHNVGGHTFSLPLGEESDGTRRFLHLLSALYYLTNSPIVFVITDFRPWLRHVVLSGLNRIPRTNKRGQTNKRYLISNRTLFSPPPAKNHTSRRGRTGLQKRVKYPNGRAINRHTTDHSTAPQFATRKSLSTGFKFVHPSLNLECVGIRGTDRDFLLASRDTTKTAKLFRHHSCWT